MDSEVGKTQKMSTIDFESHQERPIEIGKTAAAKNLQFTNVKTYEDYQENLAKS